MFSPDISHERFLQNKPLLSFRENDDFAAQQTQVRETVTALLGEMYPPVDFNLQVLDKQERDTFYETRFTFYSEADVQVVGHLWVPKTGKEKYPGVICIQGHSTGMHISMGRAVYPGDEELMHGGDRDFAVQAIARGYAVLVIDQRGMGERRTDKLSNDGPRCAHTAMNALLVGRTMLGERVLDIRRLLDLVESHPMFSMIDTDRIGCMGNSGGGTATYYAACMEPRIKVAMPSCAVCTYKDSIGAMEHCTCNYIPGIARYVDMGDLALMIAPRKLVVVAGKEDPIFPAKGVQESYDTIEKIYAAAGAPENCTLIWGEGGHRFYAKQGWAVFDKMMGL